MIQIALNPGQFRDRPLLDVPAIAADLGYRYVDLSGRDDFVPFFRRPNVRSDTVDALRAAFAKAGVRLVAMYGLFRWTSADESERDDAVASMIRTIEIAAQLGCPAVSTEFGQSSAASGPSETRFRRSLEQVLPILDKHDVSLWIEPHPDDFIEDSNAAVDMIRALGSPRLGYLYCVPHTFHIGGDIATMIRHAGDLLRHVHVADVFHPKRYILNPMDSAIRVHQHLDIGQGEIDWDAFFAAIREIGYRGALAACVAAWDDRPTESAQSMRKSMEDYLAKYPPRQQEVSMTQATTHA